MNRARVPDTPRARAAADAALVAAFDAEMCGGDLADTPRAASAVACRPTPLGATRA